MCVSLTRERIVYLSVWSVGFQLFLVFSCSNSCTLLLFLVPWRLHQPELSKNRKHHEFKYDSANCTSCGCLNIEHIVIMLLWADRVIAAMFEQTSAVTSSCESARDYTCKTACAISKPTIV